MRNSTQNKAHRKWQALQKDMPELSCEEIIDEINAIDLEITLSVIEDQPEWRKNMMKVQRDLYTEYNMRYVNNER